MDNVKMEGLKTALNFLGTIGTIYVLVNAAFVNMYTPDPDKCHNLESALFVIWMQLDIIINFCFVFGNIAFLALRSCIKHKIRIDAVFADEDKIPDIDTMTALQRLAANFTNELIPAISAAFLYWNPSTTNFKTHTIMEKQLFTAFISSCIGLVFITTLIFVSWHKGSSCWKKVAPTLFYIMTLSIYIFIPLANILFEACMLYFP